MAQEQLDIQDAQTQSMLSHVDQLHDNKHRRTQSSNDFNDESLRIVNENGNVWDREDFVRCALAQWGCCEPDYNSKVNLHTEFDAHVESTQYILLNKGTITF
ncbi:unnamed protein product [Didymodactylos carnosus]|uniref:Uncharacterized protein n=1 Tax=Didymodactylos carnosus TaxID=1234261 RepID=A0A8S2UL20_9BILA|nr:unnamed protein product [Didymodactylos carnosus]CAF4348542.1 unnamed protein product [Didymodactylos carnosus]